MGSQFTNVYDEGAQTYTKTGVFDVMEISPQGSAPDIQIYDTESIATTYTLSLGTGVTSDSIQTSRYNLVEADTFVTWEYSLNFNSILNSGNINQIWVYILVSDGSTVNNTTKERISSTAPSSGILSYTLSGFSENLVDHRLFVTVTKDDQSIDCGSITVESLAYEETNTTVLINEKGIFRRTGAGNVEALSGGGAVNTLVSSVFGRTGDVAATDGDYSKSLITGLKDTDDVVFNSGTFTQSASADYFDVNDASATSPEEDSNIFSIGSTTTYRYLQTWGSTKLRINPLGNNIELGTATDTISSFGAFDAQNAIDITGGGLSVGSTEVIDSGRNATFVAGTFTGNVEIDTGYLWTKAGISYLSGGAIVGSSNVPTYDFEVDGNSELRGWLWLSQATDYIQVDGRIGIGVTPFGSGRLSDNEFQLDGSMSISTAINWVAGSSVNDYTWSIEPKGNDLLNVQNFGTPYAVLSVAGDNVTDPSTDSSEGTLALYRGDQAGTNSEFLDLYNNGYTTSREYGINIQKRGTGEFRRFLFGYDDGTTYTNMFTVNPPDGTNDVVFDVDISAPGGNSTEWNTGYDRSVTSVVLSNVTPMQFDVTINKQDGSSETDALTISASNLSTGTGLTGSDYDGISARTFSVDDTVVAIKNTATQQTFSSSIKADGFIIESADLAGGIRFNDTAAQSNSGGDITFQLAGTNTYRVSQQATTASESNFVISQ